MPEYQGSKLIELSPDEVFAFVSDVRMLPAYVPTVREATPLPEGRVRVAGQRGEQEFVDDGFVKIDEDRRRMEWRADEANYNGWLQVGDEDGLARVLVHLSFMPEKVPEADPIVRDEVVRDQKPVLGRDIDDDPISVSLDGALRSLHDLMIGRGGKRVLTKEPLPQIPPDEQEHPW
jgi:hypothetical protein